MPRRRGSIDSWDLFNGSGVHRETRTLYIGGSCDEEEDHDEVNSLMSRNVAKGLVLLEGDSVEKPILVILNSPGGDVQHGLAVYDMLTASPCPIIIRAAGNAMSMGAAILQAGTERYLYPNARMMVHHGAETTSGTELGSLKNEIKVIEEQRDIYCKILAERSGQTIKYWYKKCNHDHYMSAEEAIKEGLADGFWTAEIAARFR